MVAKKKYQEKRLPSDLAAGENLKKIRTALGMEQFELAMKVGYSGAAGISHLETGLRGINIDMLTKLAKAFKTDPRVLGMMLLDEDTHKLSGEEIRRVLKYAKLQAQKKNDTLPAINALIDSASV